MAGEWLKERVGPQKLAAQLRAAGHEITRVRIDGSRGVMRVPRLEWRVLAGG